MKKRALGKGLNALITDIPTDIMEEGDENSILEIAIGQIQPNPNQPRKLFIEEKLTELAESIKENGIIQPILVREIGDHYQIVVGERRYRAAQIAGLYTIPCLVKEFSEEKVLELALIENLQREDLNSIEIANSYNELLLKLNITQEELSKKIGKSRSAIANTLRLLKLPQDIQTLVIEGLLTEGHARAILSVEDLDKMIVLKNEILDKKLTVREAEELASQIISEKKLLKKEMIPANKKPEIRDLENRFTEIIGTKVVIRDKGNKGKIEIEYYSLDDFERIKTVLESSKKTFWN